MGMGLNVNFIFQQQFDNGKKQNGNSYYLVLVGLFQPTSASVYI